jgi:transcriptional regulator with XRE-family HTH domain
LGSSAIDANNDKDGMTPLLCRTARTLVNLSQAELAERAGISPLSVRNYEGEKTEPSYKTWRAIRTALEQAGVQFIDENEASAGGGPGVRLRKAR